MKSLLESKTFWVAALQAAAGVLVVFSTSFPEAGWIMMGKSVVDIILRVMTTTAVA